MVGSLADAAHSPFEGHVAMDRIANLSSEFLDFLFFWNALDLERKLQSFLGYCDGICAHESFGGSTPWEEAGMPRLGYSTLCSR
jgi:hypothetical protein